MQTIFISGPKINKTISIFRCCLKLEVELLLIGVGKILDMAGKIKDKGGIDDLVEATSVVEAAGEVDVTSIQDLLVASKLLEEHSYNSPPISPAQSLDPYPSLSVTTGPLPANLTLQHLVEAASVVESSKLLEERKHSYNSSPIPPAHSSDPYPSLSVTTGPLPANLTLQNLVEAASVVETSKLLEEHSYNSSTIPPDQSSYPYPSLSVSTCPLPPNTPLQNPLQVHDYCVAAGENELAGTSNCSVEEVILWYTYWFTV